MAMASRVRYHSKCVSFVVARSFGSSVPPQLPRAAGGVMSQARSFAAPRTQNGPKPTKDVFLAPGPVRAGRILPVVSFPANVLREECPLIHKDDMGIAHRPHRAQPGGFSSSGSGDDDESRSGDPEKRGPPPPAPPSPLAPWLQDLVLNMRATAHFHDALGLASPQIGVTARVFLMRRPKQMLADRGLRPRTTSFEVCMNPEVLRSTDRESLSPEACLSLPGYDAFVRRKHVITAQWVDEHGTKRKETLRGLPAAVFQHELDHLDGVLLVDREITDVADTAAAEEAEQRYDDELDRHYPRAARRAPAPSAQIPVDRV